MHVATSRDRAAVCELVELVAVVATHPAHRHLHAVSAHTRQAAQTFNFLRAMPGCCVCAPFRTILRLRAAESVAALARDYGISRQSVYNYTR